MSVMIIKNSNTINYFLKISVVIFLLFSCLPAFGQDSLVAQFDLSFPNEAPFCRCMATSTKQADGNDPNITIVTDTLEVVSYDTSFDGVGCSAIWFGVHQDGSGMGKVWTGAYTGTESAVNTWQTFGRVQVSPGIIFTNAWVFGSMPAVYRRMSYLSQVTANSWALGQQQAVSALENVSLKASYSNDKLNEHKILFECSVIPDGDLFKYTYIIKNNTPKKVTVGWGENLRDINLEKGETFSHTLLSDKKGTELKSIASVKSDSCKNTDLRANIIVPMS